MTCLFLTPLPMMGYYSGYDGYLPFGHLAFFGPALMILFWIFIIALVIYFVRSGACMSGKSEKHDGETALDVLKKRYARGEIDKKEFDAMKKDIL